MPKNDSRLGKGLGALLGDVLETPPETEHPVRTIPLETIRPNRFQPRQEFDDAAIADLRASIEANGLLQPIVVRRTEAGYELVAGERRWRAMRELGWESSPAIVRELSDEAMLVLALVENIQRESLNAIEEAVAFQQLIDGFGFTQKEVASRLGRDRSTVANAMRLLRLPKEVRDLVESGRLTAGHARAILTAEGEETQVALARTIVREDLSVREAERRARAAQSAPTRKSSQSARKRGHDSPVARRAATLLGRSLGTGVDVRLTGKASGEIRIPFHDADDFERLLRRLLAGDASELFDGDGPNDGDRG